MTTELQTSNGRSEQPASLDDLKALGERLERQMVDECADLRRMLEGEQLLTNRMRGILDLSNARVKRIQRALNALEGTGKTIGRPKAAKPNPKINWTVSEKKVEATYEALVAIGGEGRASEVTRRAGHSTEVTRRSLEQLREAERVRIVRRDKKFGATFGVMPTSDEAADAA